MTSGPNLRVELLEQAVMALLGRVQALERIVEAMNRTTGAIELAQSMENGRIDMLERHLVAAGLNNRGK